MSLTPKQRRFVEVMADPHHPAVDDAIAGAVGVKVSTIARWRADPALKEKIEERVRELTDERMPRVWSELTSRAETGDVNAARLLFQVRGEFIEKRREEVDHPPPTVTILLKPAAGMMESTTGAKN
jgi:hypothetical protein